MDKLYSLSYLIRYSNVKRIKDESVAEHSFYVAAEVIKLYEEYKFDLHKAVFIAICHDFLESDVDDVSFYTKNKFPSIKKAVEEAEDEALKTYPVWIQEAINEYNDSDTLESDIVKLADTTQCLTYTSQEIMLGNWGYMKEVNDKVKIRIEKLKTRLEGAKR